jgi:hypothetical protein
MSRRLELVEDARRGLSAMTELCARYGISRRVGYKWLARYETDGVDGLADQRRVAHSHPHRMPAEIAAALLACRGAHPTWGPRKLLAYLERRHPRTPWPAAPYVARPAEHGADLYGHGDQIIRSSILRLPSRSALAARYTGPG